ncbi:transcription repressor OFP7-like [Chenopodium quinoa]|nr:transcription repressor OFP7-like [Chenopodium quinoa]
MSQFKRKKLFKNLGLGCGCASTTNSNATHVFEPKPIPKLKPRPSTLSSSNDGETYSSISPSTSSMLSSNWQSCNSENIDKKMITATASASATSPSVSRRWNNMGDQQTTDNISTTAVVMESENPYDDFQQSMLEMITENQIFSAEELLQLLHCFLSLNSPAHHHLILCAFFQVSQYAIVSSSK